MVMNIAVYADVAMLDHMRELAKIDNVSGFTTNPSILKKSEIYDYKEFAKEVLSVVGAKPVSFEVLADEMFAMHAQAMKIAEWGQNVYVKIPITNTAGESTAPVIKSLAQAGVKVNVTAIFTKEQVRTACTATYGSHSIVSIFAGRIADTGVNPEKLIRYAKTLCDGTSTKVLWASTREVYSLYRAEKCGCDIITMPPELLGKLRLLGKDLAEFSLETVKQFHEDGKDFTI